MIAWHHCRSSGLKFNAIVGSIFGANRHRIFASNFDPCSCRQAPSLLYQAGLAITASPGSNLNANQHLRNS